MITQEYLKSILHYDESTGIFTWLPRVDDNLWNARFAGKKAGTNRGGYVSIWVLGGGRSAHRLAFIYMTGKAPKIIDHINTIKSDNRFSNLRPSSSSRNKANARLRSDNTSGFKGVSFHSRENNYRACIGYNGKVIQIGQYSCPIEAANAYDEKAKTLFGSHALTNKSMGLI